MPSIPENMLTFAPESVNKTKNNKLLMVNNK